MQHLSLWALKILALIIWGERGIPVPGFSEPQHSLCMNPGVRPQRFGKTQAEIIDVRNNHRLGSGLLAEYGGACHAA